MNGKKESFLSRFSKRGVSRRSRTQKTTITIAFDKRQKFVISVLLLSSTLFFTEFYHLHFSKTGFFVAFFLSLLSDVFLWWAIRNELPKFRSQPYSYSIFILPFFYTLAFALFYFLVPARIISRVILTLLYAVGLYSLYLCQNIFTVGATRTIQLLSGARIVSFVLTLLSFFFLTNIIFTLHLPIYYTGPFLLVVTFFLILQSVWTYAIQSETASLSSWTLLLTVCVLEVAVMLWFWPSSPTIIALFLTGFFYTIVGLSHVWFDRRLFRGVLWEYVWVSAVVFFVLLLATTWGK